LDLHSNTQSRLQEVSLDFLGLPQSQLSILREDELHPIVSGNKYRKLKYNLIEARNKGYDRLLTFGGAHSNHILALAAAGKEQGFKTIGVIRGEELVDANLWGPTLQKASSLGMKFHFVGREAYRKKESADFLAHIQTLFPPFFLIPEGGTNELAVLGCEEILDERTDIFDTIAVAVGTGGTLAGLANSIKPHQRLIGFSVLNGTFQSALIQKLSPNATYNLTDAYAFGGYAKIDLHLIRFINEFFQVTGIPLDPVYTGKMMYGLMDLLQKGELHQNSSILAIHTGGLQGIEAMNEQLKKKNWPQISF